MSRTIITPDGILTLSDNEFDCPKCGLNHDGEEYYNRLCEKGLIYIKCKNCKTNLGITPDIKGDIQVWEKSKEIH